MCMLHHSFSRSTFCISTMIPIPKAFNKDVSKSQNYRGIALCSLFSKIFDHCIISCEDAALMSDYLHNKSDIYMCAIDASKAFDRVNPCPADLFLIISSCVLDFFSRSTNKLVNIY